MLDWSNADARYFPVFQREEFKLQLKEHIAEKSFITDTGGGGIALTTSDADIAESAIDCFGEVLTKLGLSDGQFISAEGVLYVYAQERGVWEAIAERHIRSVLQLFSGALVAEVDSKNKHKAIKLSAGTCKSIASLIINFPFHQDDKFFDFTRPGFNDQRRFYAVTAYGVEPKPKSPANRSRVFFDEDLYMEAKAKEPTEWLNFLRDIFYNADLKEYGDPEEETTRIVNLVQQWIGAAVCGLSTKLDPRVLTLVGGGSNGKSTVMKAIAALFPSESVTTVDPQDFGSNNAIVPLLDSLINIVAEIDPKHALSANSNYKSIIAGDKKSVERKYVDPFCFSPRSAHLFGCNELPQTHGDSSHGMARRQLFIRCRNRFVAGAGAVSEEQILDNIEPENGQILRWAIDGAISLIKAGAYNIPVSVRAEIEEWKADNNPVERFLTDCYDICTAKNKKGNFVPLKVLGENYQVWRMEGGDKPYSNTELGRKIRSINGVIWGNSSGYGITGVGAYMKRKAAGSVRVREEGQGELLTPQAPYPMN